MNISFTESVMLDPEELFFILKVMSRTERTLEKKEYKMEEQNKHSSEQPVSPSSSCVSTSRDSISEIVNTNADVQDGMLDLSNQQITNICPSFKAKYNDVVELNISQNTLHALKSELFPNCVKLNISHNRLNRVSTLLPLKVLLKELNLSNNDIIKLDGIQNFLRLEVFYCADNALRDMPLLQTYSLRELDLSGNLFPDLPDLSKLRNLEVLHLSGNKISNLKNIRRLPSNSLINLSISSNPIEDISELLSLCCFKQLQHLSVYPLPALPGSENPPFNYRHYILCILPSLSYIDGLAVEKEDTICGELLLMQGKLTGSKREFNPGSGNESHNYVWDYLTKKDAELVEGQTKKGTPLKANIMQVLNMKERYDRLNPRSTLSPRQNAILSPALSRATEDEYSSHSPYADWSKRMGKENTEPDTTDASPVSTQRSGVSRNLRIIETGVGTKTSLKQPESRQSIFEFSTPQNTDRNFEEEENIVQPVESISHESSVINTARSPETPKAVQPPQPKPRITRVEKNAVKLFSPDAELSPVNENRFQYVTPNKSIRLPTTPISRRRGFTPARKFGVADITASSYLSGENDVYDRIEQLESKMNEMFNFCNTLSKTNEELSHLLVEQKNKFNDELKRMQEEIESLKVPPMPAALSVLRRDGNSVDVKWQLQHVKGYNVYINGSNSGTIISAPSRVARISDLEKNKEYEVQLQAIGYDGKEGLLSQPLKINL